MKETKNIQMTKKYLKDHDLVAVPYDKGTGICLMKRKTYEKKMDKIIELPQFQKYIPDRSNAKHLVLKEEERIIEILQDLKKSGAIDKTLYKELYPTGTQAPRLYGLAKIHKEDTPMRPVLSMPGSAYHTVGKKIAEWLSYVPECKINTSTKKICDSLKETKLKQDEQLVSFDVKSLYTNVPVKEAIEYCADLLFKKFDKLPVDRKTFVTLAEIACCNVIMATHNGFYIQVEGLAMGSPPAPHLANGWMSQFDPIIKGDSSVYERYMDDIITEKESEEVETKLIEINGLHPSLGFTMEREVERRISFLEMTVTNNNGNLSSTWYTKPTDTGLIMNFHALAPKRYKRSVVSGFVHRIYRACSDWNAFHESLERAKKILQKNQYPEAFYEPIISETLTKIIQKDSNDESVLNLSDFSSSAETESVTQNNNIDLNEAIHSIEDKDKFRLFVQYRGKVTDELAQKLHQINAPCRIVMTLRKLKTMMPSLKPPVTSMMRSNVVYQITCSRFKACCVDATSRHYRCRFSERKSRKGCSVKQHINKCNVSLCEKDVTILGYNNREDHLFTLEAILQFEIRPKINGKEEFKTKTLSIIF